MSALLNSATRIIIAFLIVHALMNGVVGAITTAIGQEGRGGIISEQWGKLKQNLFGLL